MNIGIYIYHHAEVLDFAGPFEVFSTANRLMTSATSFNVFLLAEEKSAVNARGNFPVLPHYDINDHPTLDMLIVAGGEHTVELKKSHIIDWIRRTADRSDYVASVCTGAFLLAEAGLLSGLKVTTHWEDIDDLRASYPSLTVLPSQRWVDEGKFITSGGISAGIDMSLHLVEKLKDRALAQKTATQMDYDWVENT